MRSASSSSPIAAAIAPSPARARRKPWFVGCGPAHVARPPPPVGAQGVEATVVADAVVRVALDLVAAHGRRAPPTRRGTGASGRRPRRGRPAGVAVEGERVGERLRRRRARPAAAPSTATRGTSRSARSSQSEGSLRQASGRLSRSVRPWSRSYGRCRPSRRRASLAIVVGAVVLAVVFALVIKMDRRQGPHRRRPAC